MTILEGQVTDNSQAARSVGDTDAIALDTLKRVRVVTDVTALPSARRRRQPLPS